MKTKLLTRYLCRVLLAAGLLTTTRATEDSQRCDDRPLVQVAVLLDTSNSMDGLIAQAKTQLWQMVNEFLCAKQDGRAPRVEVALYEYGNDGLSAEKGYVRQVTPLTTDLDRVSEALFRLKTNGGSEYCGWVIRDALRDLAWNSSPKVYKAIFIAGNEEFTQGPVRYTESCKVAAERGVIVNTIHCGDRETGITGRWQDGAMLGGGKYMTIEQSAQLTRIEAPQDKTILELNIKLNGTYLGYGAAGDAGKARQVAQDANAATAPAAPTVTAERAKTKASANYSNSAWDLLDAVREKKLELSTAKDSELPEDLRKLAPAARADYVAEKQKEREQLQAQIRQLTAERDQYVAQQQKAAGPDQRLDQAVTRAIREQAAKKAFVFEGK
jgi:hypothetical protein